MQILRNGTIIKDRRLDRLPSFDERSRNYPIRKLVEGLEPKTVLWGCDNTLDQGGDGACVGFGCTHELIAEPVPVLDLDNKYAKETIYWGAQKNDEWPGGSYPGAVPFYEGTSVLAGLQITQSLGWWDAYYWGFNIDDLILGLQQGPAILGLTWKSDMMDIDSDGYIFFSGEVEGGHCILCRGWNNELTRFTLRQSWGSWGVGGTGDCYISRDEMEKAMNDQGEMAFPVGRHESVEPQPPEPEPSNCQFSNGMAKSLNEIWKLFGKKTRFITTVERR